MKRRMQVEWSTSAGRFHIGRHGEEKSWSDGELIATGLSRVEADVSIKGFIEKRCLIPGSGGRLVEQLQLEWSDRDWCFHCQPRWLAELDPPGSHYEVIGYGTQEQIDAIRANFITKRNLTKHMDEWYHGWMAKNEWASNGSKK